MNELLVQLVVFYKYDKDGIFLFQLSVWKYKD